MCVDLWFSSTWCYFYELPLPSPSPSSPPSPSLSFPLPIPPHPVKTYRISHYYFLPWDSEEMCDLKDHQWRRDTFVHFLVISEGLPLCVHVHVCMCECMYMCACASMVWGEGDSLLSPLHSQNPWEVGKACVPVCVSVWRWEEEIVVFSVSS